MTNHTTTKNALVVSAGLLSAITIFGYALTYQLAPFSEFANAFILNTLIVVPALACALLISRVVLYFEKGEPLRRIWTSYALAIWMWAVAEVIWAAYNLAVEAVPDFSAADVLWIVAYIFLADALSHQFGLVMFDRSRRPFWIGVTILVVVFAIAFLITWLTGGGLEEFSGYFYPIADFAVGVVALILVISFRRGRMAWPWLSLLVFMVSDTLYTWAIATGVYDWNAGGGILTLLIDLVYVVAYICMAWAVLSQYLVLRFGAAVPEEVSQPLPVKPKSMF